MLIQKKKRRINIGGIDFDPLSYQVAVQEIVLLAKSDRGGLVVTPNTAHLLEIERNSRFRALVRDADFVLADGMPIVLASKVLGRPLPDKISGSDLIYDLCREASESGVGVFLLGGHKGQADVAAENLVGRYPSLKVTTYFPPYGFEKSPQQSELIIQTIKNSGARLVFVGVGCPKQEFWAQEHKQSLPKVVFMGVGISIAFCSGATKRAPTWMQRFCLEWLYRLCQEPKRLGLRYAKCFVLPFLILKNL